jgi:pyruvate/2-oxoglutarate dehydrogenase complex dihydrolipoamide acyltransferase (E2) component
MSDEVPIRIPRVSVAVSEATLTELLVPDGGHVDDGAPLFVVQTEKVENEVPAAAGGTVHWSGTVGAEYESGDQIGVIHVG